MGTKSNRSSGTQFNPKGLTQGNTLVDPFTGLPIHVITDNAGVRRLAVDANITAQNIQVEVNLDSDEDEVAVEDPDTGAHIRVEPDGSINVNTNVDAGDGDNIAIHDADGDELNVNPDGSINVNIVSAVASGTYKNVYNEISSVLANVTTPILTYTVPMGKTAIIQRAVVSGTNIATYEVSINAILQDKLRTYFGDNLNETFEFADIEESGIELIAGDIVTISVTHIRPNVGDFNCRLQLIEI